MRRGRVRASCPPRHGVPPPTGPAAPAPEVVSDFRLPDRIRCDGHVDRSVAQRQKSSNADGRPPKVGHGVSCALFGRDRLFLDVLAGMLQLRRGLRILPQAVDAEACTTLQPDLVILDVDGLDAAGLRLAGEMAGRREQTRFVLIIAATRSRSLPRAVTACPHVIVAKDEPFAAVLGGIETLFGDRLVAAVADGGPQRHKPLTDREAEVLSLMGEGLTSKEIARVLGRSAHTIQTHRKRIAGKLGRLGSALTRRVIAHRHTYFRNHDSPDGR